MTRVSGGPTDHWRRPLRELLPHLTEQLPVNPRPRVQLPHGAFVGLSRTPLGQRVVRIARELAPETEAGLRRWRLELDTFRRQFGIEAWTEVAQAPKSGIAVAYVEPPLPQEVS